MKIEIQIDDLDRAITRRKKRSKKFAENFDEGYEEFKLGAALAKAREKAGLTQNELARRVKTTKSVVSRWERHPSNMRMATLQKIADALGLGLSIKLVR